MTTNRVSILLREINNFVLKKQVEFLILENESTLKRILIFAKAWRLRKD
jgi:hypothetical protein